MHNVKQSYKNKKVLILGLGLNQGGVGAAKFFVQAGAKVKVTDLKTAEILQPSLDQLKEFPNIEYSLGEHRHEDIDWADLIIRNPALKPDNEYLKYAQEKGKQVEMDMGIFLEYVKPEQIIGVTGTKGKSTTATLIYEVLKAAGKDVTLAGNIRTSVLDLLATKSGTLQGYVVLELSSFQLQAFQKHKVSPHLSVITNIFPDHLNYHSTMKNYIEAKRAITKYQTDENFLFINKADDITNQLKFLKSLKGQIIHFSADDLPKTFRPLLPGQHNLSNMAAALAVTQHLGIPPIKALAVMQKFPGIDFRLQLIKETNGVKIYNDSAATNPESTIQALQALPNSILICGGMNKGLDYSEMAQAIDKYAKVVYFLEGDIVPILHSSIFNLESKDRGTYDNFQDLLKKAFKEAQPGDTILFSPGATSFNLFQNEFDRGEKFNKAVADVIK